MDRARSISSLFASPIAGDASAAFHDGKPVPFARLADDVAALSAQLQERPEQRWLLMAEDAYAIAVGFLATLYAGRIIVFPANLQPGHIAELSKQFDGILAHGQAAQPAAPMLEIFAPDTGAEKLPLHSFDARAAEIILHTSGTTGAPLAVHKSLACLEAELSAFAEVFEQPIAYTVLATVPAHHIYGLLFRVLWPLVAGRPFVAELIRYPEELERALAKAENNLLISSPAFLGRALKVLDIDALKASLTTVFSSGGPLAPEIAAAYNAQLNAPIIEVYGSTETGGIGYRSVLDAFNPAPLTPLPGVTLAINPEDDILSVDSPFLPDGQTFQTADRARLLPDGRFELLGRADRIVKIEERRISLSEVEQKLATEVEVAAIHVEMLAGSTGRNFLGAVIVPTEAGWDALAENGKRVLTQKLRNALMPHMELAAIPRKWRFVRKMPETVQGKIILAQLQAMFSQSPEDVTRPILVDRQSSATTLQLKLKLPGELKYFDGHFDDYPILPGVIQLGWAIEFARDEFSLSAAVERIDALKFFRVLTAGEEVTLELAFERTKDRLSFKYNSAQHAHSAGRIQFGAAA